MNTFRTIFSLARKTLIASFCFLLWSSGHLIVFQYFLVFLSFSLVGRAKQGPLWLEDLDLRPRFAWLCTDHEKIIKIVVVEKSSFFKIFDQAKLDHDKVFPAKTVLRALRREEQSWQNF